MWKQHWLYVLASLSWRAQHRHGRQVLRQIRSWLEIHRLLLLRNSVWEVHSQEHQCWLRSFGHWWNHGKQHRPFVHSWQLHHWVVQLWLQLGQRSLHWRSWSLAVGIWENQESDWVMWKLSRLRLHSFSRRRNRVWSGFSHDLKAKGRVSWLNNANNVCVSLLEDSQ